MSRIDICAAIATISHIDICAAIANISDMLNRNIVSVAKQIPQLQKHFLILKKKYISSCWQLDAQNSHACAISTNSVHL